MIKNIFLILTIWRSVPAFVIFYTLQQKQAVVEDMKRWGEEGTVWSLHKLLMESKVFRKIFLARVSFESKKKTEIFKIVL